MTKSGNVKVFAWDGTEFREIVIDTLGHPQVDVLSVANPPNLDKAISKLIDKRIVALASTQTGTIAAGSSETITFTPSAGKLWRVIGLSLKVNAPPGASSGTHIMHLCLPRGTRAATRGESNYYTRLDFDGTCWVAADISKRPPDEANLGIVLARLAYDNTYPAKFGYFNRTNVSQTNSRIYELEVLEEYCS